MSHLLDRLTFFRQKKEPFSEGHGVTTAEARDWEDGYRQRWQHDTAPKRRNKADQHHHDVAGRQARRIGVHAEPVEGRGRALVVFLVEADVQGDPGLESAVVFPGQALRRVANPVRISQGPVLDVGDQLHTEGNTLVLRPGATP